MIDYQQLYWLDINVTLQNVFFTQSSVAGRINKYRQPWSLGYCVLEGVGAVKKALTVVQDRLEFDRFVVRIAGYEEDTLDESELGPRSCRLVWDNTDAHSLQSVVYIAHGLLRHLVELFVTKRIDEVQLSVQIAVAGGHPSKLEVASDGLPLLGEAGRLHFRRSRCELLSVYTSLAKN